MNAIDTLVERNVHWFNLHDQPHELAPVDASRPPREITYVTGGRQHGSIRRLVSPKDLGELIKPFVFLDHVALEGSSGPLFGMHPHSGIATVTAVLDGEVAYEDTTGKSGIIPSGGLEWMKAGSGVWHDGTPIPGKPFRGFQLWLALQAGEEGAPPESQYFSPREIPHAGPARVLLGRYAGVQSPVHGPGGVTYLHVELKDGERWTFTPPPVQEIAWLAVDSGALAAARTVHAGQLAIFKESSQPIVLEAQGDTSFVLGSAIKHPYPLVVGRSSVHTSHEALASGEAGIERVGRQLQSEGRI
ncbi:MAG TPA: pirin family protein [Usitatibacter sp.]|nr:pirin family protein [Usitatibacter sp.]